VPSGDPSTSPPVTVPLPTAFTSVISLPITNRTAVAVSSCQGVACTTIDGRTFSFIPTLTSSAQGIGTIVAATSIARSHSPLVSAHGPATRTHNIFHRGLSTIVIVTATCYFGLAIATIVSVGIYRRRRRRLKKAKLTAKELRNHELYWADAGNEFVLVVPD